MGLIILHVERFHTMIQWVLQVPEVHGDVSIMIIVVLKEPFLLFLRDVLQFVWAGANNTRSPYTSYEPEKTTKVSRPKTAYLGTLWHSVRPHPFRYWYERLNGGCRSLKILVIQILPKENITLSMKGIPCPTNSLFPTVVCNIILMNAAVRFSGICLSSSFEFVHL